MFEADFSKKGKLENEIYATNITITTERSLTIYTGNKVYYKNKPYIISPANYNQGVEIKILNYLGKEKTGATFSDNCFNATEPGTYYLRFTVKTKYNTTKYDAIKIKVIDEAPDCQAIKLLVPLKVITINESVNLLQYVTSYNLAGKELTFSLNNKIIENAIFSPSSVGSYKIKAYIDNGDYLIFEFFEIIVKNDLKISIKLYDIKNSIVTAESKVECLLKNQILMFSYIVEGLTSQIINIEINNKEIVSCISSDSPIIIFELLDKGETEIIIKIANKDISFKFYLLVK